MGLSTTTIIRMQRIVSERFIIVAMRPNSQRLAISCLTHLQTTEFFNSRAIMLDSRCWAVITTLISTCQIYQRR